jgi:NAD(P)H-dependent flavin oxidoreductase YrpB (nitropropane dioxygenase family)
MFAPAAGPDRLTELLGIEYPVLQAGMGAATSPALVAAVSAGGGLGILGCLRRSSAEVSALTEEIKTRTSQPFAVNHVIAHLNREAFELTLDSGVPVVSTAWGDPRDVVAAAHASGSRVVHQVTTVAEAMRAADVGVDVIVAQGGEGGGHVGQRTTLTLVPEVVDAVTPTPVVAAGGIVDERGVAAAIALGASGVLIGTRFLATNEAPVSERWKGAVLTASGDQTVTSKFYDAIRGEDWPGAIVRTVRNRWTDEWAARADEWPAVAEELRPSFLEGFAAGEFPMAGEGVGLIHDVLAANELPRRLWEDARTLLARLATGNS